MRGRLSGKTARQGTLALLLAGVAAAVLPSASGCQGRQDELRNCDVPALFRSSCSGSVCHGAENPRAGLDLVSPGLERRLFHVQGTSDCDNRKLIFPGRPDDSLIYIKVTDEDPFCGKRMPIDKELSESEISCLRSYIRAAGSNTDVEDCETCGGILCVDFEGDPLHCGGCDQPCAEGKVCGAGECIDACSIGEAQCGNSCVVLDSNESHCGSCGHRCGPGSSCDQGVCVCDPSGSGAGGGGGATGTPVAEIPSFKEDILPIFENACSGTGANCHATVDHEAPLGLDPAEAYANLVGVTSEDCGGKNFVVAGSPDQSYLIDKLMGGTICEGGQMPLDQDPLPTAGVRTFVNWICAGAPDN